MEKKIEKLLKKIKEMNEHKVEFNTQVAIIETELKTMLENEKIKALDEFEQLRNDDEDFKKQWGKNDFQEWFEDVYLPSINN